MRTDAQRVVITGAGLVSPIADDVEALWEAVCGGRSPGRQRPELALDGMPGPWAALHDDFDARAELGREGLRALDRTGRLASVAAKRALEASGWSATDREDQEVGLVLGTFFGSLRTISGFDRRGVSAGPSYAKPLDFVNSVINAAAGQTAIRFNLRGVNATISGDLTSGLQALGYAADLIRGGRARALLAGGADELCVESLYGFHKLGLLRRESSEGTAALGDARSGGSATTEMKTGMTPTEAAALLMLESLESARQRGATILAEIVGHGTAFDPSRGAQGGDASAMTDAVRSALRDSDRPASAVGCVSLGANGTPLDAREAEGLGHALPTDAPTPAFASKAGTGETLGSSGALQTLLAIESLRRGRLPGTPQWAAVNPPAPATHRETSTLAGPAALVSAVGLQGKATALLAEVAQ